MRENEIMVVITKARELVITWIDSYVWVHGYTEKECAQVLNTSVSTISRIVTYGESAPLSDRMFLKLADKITEIEKENDN